METGSAEYRKGERRKNGIHVNIHVFIWMCVCVYRGEKKGNEMKDEENEGNCVEDPLVVGFVIPTITW